MKIGCFNCVYCGKLAFLAVGPLGYSGNLAVGPLGHWAFWLCVLLDGGFFGLGYCKTLGILALGLVTHWVFWPRVFCIFRCFGLRYFGFGYFGFAFFGVELINCLCEVGNMVGLRFFLFLTFSIPYISYEVFKIKNQTQIFKDYESVEFYRFLSFFLRLEIREKKMTHQLTSVLCIP